MTKVCVVTGTRAEYGLLRWVMEGIRASSTLELQVLATGMHLSPEFGLTYREIEADGFRIDHKVEMLLSSDTPVGISKSAALGIIGCTEAFRDLAPDLVLLLGDRYEVLAAATAAMIGRIPIAHLHGGEATEGLIDEPIRHSVTKMSHLHFVSTEEYRRRVIQLGESPDRVVNVGALGLDGIQRLRLLDRSALEKTLDFRFGSQNLLVTFHPVTLETETAEAQTTELLEALESLKDTNIVFTMPNADTDGRAIIRLIEAFVARHPDRAKAFASLGQLRYFSTVAQVDGVIGNSSSGLIEVPSFRKGTINIGDRQRGRIMAKSVIQAEPRVSSIRAALEQLYSASFQRQLADVRNPYGTCGASERIVEILERTQLEGILKKRFHDLSA